MSRHERGSFPPDFTLDSLTPRDRAQLGTDFLRATTRVLRRDAVHPHALNQHSSYIDPDSGYLVGLFREYHEPFELARLPQPTLARATYLHARQVVSPRFIDPTRVVFADITAIGKLREVWSTSAKEFPYARLRVGGTKDVFLAEARLGNFDTFPANSRSDESGSALTVGQIESAIDVIAGLAPKHLVVDGFVGTKEAKEREDEVARILFAKIESVLGSNKDSLYIHETDEKDAWFIDLFPQHKRDRGNTLKLGQFKLNQGVSSTALIRNERVGEKMLRTSYLLYHQESDDSYSITKQRVFVEKNMLGLESFDIDLVEKGLKQSVLDQILFGLEEDSLSEILDLCAMVDRMKPFLGTTPQEDE